MPGIMGHEPLPTVFTPWVPGTGPPPRRCSTKAKAKATGTTKVAAIPNCKSSLDLHETPSAPSTRRTSREKHRLSADLSRLSWDFPTSPESPLDDLASSKSTTLTRQLLLGILLYELGSVSRTYGTLLLPRFTAPPRGSRGPPDGLPVEAQLQRLVQVEDLKLSKLLITNFT